MSLCDPPLSQQGPKATHATSEAARCVWSMGCSVLSETLGEWGQGAGPNLGPASPKATVLNP